MRKTHNFYSKMDAILAHMTKTPEQNPLRPDSICENGGLKIDRAIAYLMCFKMAEDGYLIKYPSSGGAIYAIKIDGIFFIETGGYAGKKELEISQANLQFWQTWAIVIGTFLAGVYGLVEIWNKIF